MNVAQNGCDKGTVTALDEIEYGVMRATVKWNNGDTSTIGADRLLVVR